MADGSLARVFADFYNSASSTTGSSTHQCHRGIYCRLSGLNFLTLTPPPSWPRDHLEVPLRGRGTRSCGMHDRRPSTTSLRQARSRNSAKLFQHCISPKKPSSLMFVWVAACCAHRAQSRRFARRDAAMTITCNCSFAAIPKLSGLASPQTPAALLRSMLSRRSRQEL